jgi:hypothetical protein
MPLLILNETTLFYTNLSTAATSTSPSSYNKVKNWTRSVSKANTTKPNSTPSLGGSSKSLVPTKRSTSSSSAMVLTAQVREPERKKIKSDNHESHVDLTTSGLLEEEDEAVEHEAAISSPLKGNQRLSSKVRRHIIPEWNANLSQDYCQGRKSVTTPKT